MESFIANVQITAMIVGFPVLIVLVVLIFWFGTRVFRDFNKIFNEMRYDRWKRTHAESDWSNIQASWELEPYEYSDYPTLELPALSEQLYNYQEDTSERS